jgi:hypothetical protein
LRGIAIGAGKFLHPRNGARVHGAAGGARGAEGAGVGVGAQLATKTRADNQNKKPIASWPSNLLLVYLSLVQSRRTRVIRMTLLSGKSAHRLCGLDRVRGSRNSDS